MPNTVKHHPSLSVLEQFCEGRLTAEVALVVAAHIDLCPHCQQLQHDIEADLACAWAGEPIAATTDNSAFAAMLQQIVSAEPAPLEAAASSLSKAKSLEFGGQQFLVPRSLQRLAAKRSKWLTLGGIATARLPSGDPHHISLLYISEQTQVPRHTHQGMEMTLVLSGEIEDENGRYVAGDLIVATPDHTHTPRNVKQEPCLCLSVLSAPLTFTEGMTRLLNPLQRFFY
ncbi:MAG TPA: anti-sigma factor [Rheinheimera sp.]|nr:anti-sigma factor [Rheinheimera sp.]